MRDTFISFLTSEKEMQKLTSGAVSGRQRFSNSHHIYQINQIRVGRLCFHKLLFLKLCFILLCNVLNFNCEDIWCKLDPHVNYPRKSGFLSITNLLFYSILTDLSVCISISKFSVKNKQTMNYRFWLLPQCSKKWSILRYAV